MHKFDLAYTIDDDEITTYLTGKMIRNTNTCLSTETYTDGQQAIDRLKSVIANNGKLPDLILLDLSMEGMDGYQFLNEFHELDAGKEICLFVLSSSIDLEDYKKSCAYQEVKGFISKPLNQEKIDKMIQACYLALT